jgi:hypothetical protein
MKKKGMSRIEQSRASSKRMDGVIEWRRMEIVKEIEYSRRMEHNGAGEWKELSSLIGAV